MKTTTHPAPGRKARLESELRAIDLTVATAIGLAIVAIALFQVIHLLELDMTALLAIALFLLFCKLAGSVSRRFRASPKLRAAEES